MSARRSRALASLPGLGLLVDVRGGKFMNALAPSAFPSQVCFPHCRLRLRSRVRASPRLPTSGRTSSRCAASSERQNAPTHHRTNAPTHQRTEHTCHLTGPRQRSDSLLRPCCHADCSSSTTDHGTLKSNFACLLPCLLACFLAYSLACLLALGSSGVHRARRCARSHASGKVRRE